MVFRLTDVTEQVMSAWDFHMASVSHSLSEDEIPVSPDEVPRQRLTDHVLGNVDDGGGAVLLPDPLCIQSVLQIPEEQNQRETENRL